MDRDIESEYERHREDKIVLKMHELNQSMVEHSEDDSARCVLCGTIWPCMVWVAAREEWDEADHA
jgi:hypothetical protein